MDPATIALILLVTACGFLDVRTGMIPNAVTYPACIAGAVLSVMSGGVGFGNSLLGFAVGFVPLFVLYLRGGLGGGDVKLMAAVGAVMGYPFVLNALISAILAGGLLALLIVIWDGQVWSTARYVLRTLRRAIDPSLEPLRPDTQRVLPFGAAITLGCYATLIANTFGYASPADLLP
jgi:prepilin peptidase CpaA